MGCGVCRFRLKIALGICYQQDLRLAKYTYDTSALQCRNVVETCLFC